MKTEEKALCQLCGDPMPPGEEMFFYHGYSGHCPKPPLPKPAYPKNVFVTWQGHDGQPFMKYLCTVHDSESMGWLERLFEANKVVFKITDTGVPTHASK